MKTHRVAAKFVPRLVTEEQKQNRVSVSQELLDRSNTDENFLRKCHNRWWKEGLQLRCWNKSAVFAVCGKILTTTKKSTAGSLKCEGDVESFFIGKIMFIMGLFHVVRQSIKSFTWRSWSFWGKLCEGRGLRRGQTRPGCCTMTMHLLTRRFLSVNF